MTASSILAFAVPVLLAQCDPVASRHIFVRSPQVASYSSDLPRFSVRALAASDVRDTVAIIERITKAHGFHREDPRWLNPGGVAIFLGQHKADGSTPACDVYLHPDKSIIEIRFEEWARFSSSELVRSINQEIFAALIQRFGSDRVTQH